MLFIKDPFTEEVQGPISLQKLKELAQSGEIDGAWEVAKSNTGPWTQAKKLKGLQFNPPKVEELLPAEEDDDDDWTTETAKPSMGQNVVNRFHDVAKSKKLDGAVQANDPLARVVLKLVYGAKEYSFHDGDFPVLSACLRIGATFLRIYFVAFFIMITIAGLALVFDNQRTENILGYCYLTGENPLFFVKDGANQFSIGNLFWALLRHCLFFLGVMGAFEFVRVIMAIEKNTR